MDGTGLPEIRSTCAYCGVGCGVLLRPDGHGGLDVRGDPDHPANFGRLCSKGSALAETVGLDERLLHPMVGGQHSDWDSALNLVAGKFRTAIDTHGPDSVAFYVSGQLLTEDYYVANKLMKGFIGSANIDTNSRLCMASSVAGHKRAFGSDTVPGNYEDLEHADLIVLVGSNLAWCHPVLHQRILAARKERPKMKLVVIDPRRTASCDGADMHLALEPGSDVALFNGLLTAIHEQGAMDAEFLQNVNGFEEALNAATSDDPATTGLNDTQLQAFYNLWIRTAKAVTVYSQGVNQSISGADKVNAILNCHLATGRIGKLGSGPFSITGQPNAMGGREVGGLANMLACHLDIENPEHQTAVRDFWQAHAMPTAPGLKAVDMFDAVASQKIKALWIIHTNPAVSMPEADKVRAAIENCDFVVVSDITAATDTARLADVLLPATAWGEKDGTVTNSERCISRQRAALSAPGQARPDWAILSDVGLRMGWKDAFDYQSPAEIFREYAALSGLAQHFGRDFDISALAEISDTEYADFAPASWPLSDSRTGGRFFADGQFFHPDSKARMLPLRHRAPASAPNKEYPFRLNTGRLRDQWHTMTRTALSARLSAHLPEPFLDINPEDAKKLHLTPAALVKVSNAHGTAILRARITTDVPRGQVFAPIHWTGETASSARIDALVPGNTDPVSGQPESKAATVAVTPFGAAWYGFAISSKRFKPTSTYWARARTTSGWRAELAGDTAPDNWEADARRLFDLPDARVQTVTDARRKQTRMAFFDKDTLVAAVFVGAEPMALMRDCLANQLGTDSTQVLAGRAPANIPDPGPVLCACYSVGINTIKTAVKTAKLKTVDEVGEALNAGTNCGSCQSEIKALIARVTTCETSA